MNTFNSFNQCVRGDSFIAGFSSGPRWLIAVTRDKFLIVSTDSSLQNFFPHPAHLVNGLIWQIASLWGSNREREREAHLPPAFCCFSLTFFSEWVLCEMGKCLWHILSIRGERDVQWELWKHVVDWKMRPCLVISWRLLPSETDF